MEKNPANDGILSKGKAKEGTAAIKVFGKSTIIGLAITFMGDQAAGYAAADAVQALPLVSTFWGGDIGIWRIQEIIEKNVYTSYQYAFYVHSSGRGSYGLIWT